MPAIDLRNFAGEVPKQGPTVLAPNQAQRATNCRLVSGEVRPYKQPLFVYTPLNDALTIYRGSNGTDSQWYTWTNDVNVCESPIADTSDYRIYYTGDGVPKKTDWALATAGSGPYPNPTTGWLNMGVPAPVAAPTCTVSGSGTGTAVTRFYVYTYLATFGSLVEESAPSPPSAQVTWEQGQTVTVNGFSAAPTANYNITGINIYRTVTGTNGATYELVATIAIATTSYADSLQDTQIPGTALPSATWGTPPANMIGLTNIGYGMLAGFVGNQLYISAPYFPHAWPPTQFLTFPAQIVGLGMMEGTLVVCTDQMPFLVSGTSPTTLTQEPLAIHEPCVSKRSVISTLTGVMYASPNGLVGISDLIQGVVTDSLIEREAWANFNATTMMACVYDGRYAGFFTLPEDGDMIDGVATNLGGIGFFLDKADEPVRALYVHMDVASFAMAPPLTFMNFYARCVYLDRQTGNMYAVSAVDLNIYQIDGDPVNFMTTDWKSKRFQYPAPLNMAAIQADADYQDPSQAAYEAAYEAAVAANTAIYGSGRGVGILGGELGQSIMSLYMLGGSSLQPLPEIADQLTFQVFVYADGELLLSWSPQDNEPIRLPSGFRAQIWEVEVAANFNVRSVTMATSMQELRAAAMQTQQQPAQGQ